jgi:hypothetical protein
MLCESSKMQEFEELILFLKHVLRRSILLENCKMNTFLELMRFVKYILL